MTLKHATEKIDWYLADTTARYYPTDEAFNLAWTVEQKASWIIRHADEAKSLIKLIVGLVIAILLAKLRNT